MWKRHAGGVVEPAHLGVDLLGHVCLLRVAKLLERGLADLDQPEPALISAEVHVERPAIVRRHAGHVAGPRRWLFAGNDADRQVQRPAESSLCLVAEGIDPAPSVQRALHHVDVEGPRATPVLQARVHADPFGYAGAHELGQAALCLPFQITTRLVGDHAQREREVVRAANKALAEVAHEVKAALGDQSAWPVALDLCTCSALVELQPRELQALRRRSVHG